jgi:hypothetical protein
MAEQAKKLELTERLRAEGRWPEAERFKNTTLAHFKARGVRDAVNAAWEAMAAAFPPLAATEATPTSNAPEVSAGQTAPVDLIDFDGTRQSPELPKDIVWVYEHLADKKATPQDAPGAGAWALLCWARTYRNRFFEQILPKALATREGDDVEAKKRRKDKMLVEEVEGMLYGFQESMAEETKAKVRAIVEDWSSQFELTISDEANSDLQSRLIHL